jgi:transposase
MKVKTLGIDLAKETFALHGVDAHGRMVVHKRLTRKRLKFLVKLEPCLVGMEACSSAHYWLLRSATRLAARAPWMSSVRR